MIFFKFLSLVIIRILYDVTNLVARIIKNTVLIQSIVGEGLEGSIRLINIVFIYTISGSFLSIAITVNVYFD
jgi:hypothetical protein